MGKLLKYLLSLSFLLNSHTVFAWYGPSFNCTKATRIIDKAICADERVSFLDQVMSDVYVYILSTENNDDEIIKTQREWIKYRDHYFSIGPLGDEEGEECSDISRLPECYSQRINKVYQFTHNEKDLNDYLSTKYRVVLGYSDIPEDKIERLLFENRFNTALNQITWAYDCVSDTEKVLKYSSPVLITEVYGSNACGGTSSAYRHIVKYCESTTGFTEVSRLDVAIYPEAVNYPKELDALNVIKCKQIPFPRTYD